MTTGAPPKPAPRPHRRTSCPRCAGSSQRGLPHAAGRGGWTAEQAGSPARPVAAAHVACAGAWAKTRCRASTSPQGPFRPSRSGWPRRRHRRQEEHPRACGEDPTTAMPGSRSKSAGKALVDCDRVAAPQEHPRECGEDPPAIIRTAAASVTPPRRRGKTSPAPRCPAVGWAHPRVGGEDGKTYTFFSRRMGAPPRRRGRRDDVPSTRRRPGRTPA